MYVGVLTVDIPVVFCIITPFGVYFRALVRRNLLDSPLPERKLLRSGIPAKIAVEKITSLS